MITLLFVIGCSSSTTKEGEAVYGNIAKITEASGICYCKENDSLYVAADNGVLYQLSKNGNIVKQKSFSNMKNHDFEGVAYDSRNDEILVAIEGPDNILVLNRDLEVLRTVNIDREDSEGRLILGKDKENGLEGIAVNENGIYLSNQSFSKLLEDDPSVVIKVDLSNLTSAYISEVIDHGYVNISGLAFYNGYLYMVTDSGNLLIKYDIKNKSVVTTYKIKSFDNALKDGAIEGITFDNEGNIYFADDNNGKIYKYKFN